MSVFERQPCSHGSRRAYQRFRCRCVRCRHANTVYIQGLRRDRARGRLPLGARIPAAGTWKRIRQMLPEFGSRAAIARRLGLRTPKLRLHTTSITVRSALRVAALYQETMTIEGA